jgi:hypothetical protein
MLVQKFRASHQLNRKDASHSLPGAAGRAAFACKRLRARLSRPKGWLTEAIGCFSGSRSTPVSNAEVAKTGLVPLPGDGDYLLAGVRRRDCGLTTVSQDAFSELLGTAAGHGRLLLPRLHIPHRIGGGLGVLDSPPCLAAGHPREPGRAARPPVSRLLGSTSFMDPERLSMLSNAQHPRLGGRC